ncbi:MAG: wax ester/triacylglycerol synthase family O-acyltransferase [Flavobacteriaceae bacterium]|nr:wax ester/triacylglycerol synthase family O-acyltransferase [Flavobacteriaceae bacterium]|tara:strand:+ start:80445 stop:82268 length:1824 start_codon:yes stop_codon:yes gene_type:complete
MIQSLIDSIIDVNAEQISGQDATFLYAESPSSPMHIATLTVVEGSLKYEDFKAIVASKLHLIPKFRKRLVNVPFNVDYPFWVDDPNFDLDLHLHRYKLPDPANWKTLRDLTSSIFSNSLDLRRPLWSVSFIEGLDNVSQVPKGSVAIISKIHHVMIDGKSGVGIMGKLFDTSKEDAENEIKPPKPYEPNSLPDDVQLLAKSAQTFFKDPLKLPKFFSESALSFVKGRVNKQIKGNRIKIQKSYSTPKTIFNSTVSPKRTWGTAILSFDRINHLRKVQGVTVNDIIVAICAGALRRYLKEKDKLPSQPLVANVPISIRTEESKDKMNNQISNMLVKIGTHIEDPIKRLEYIQFQTSQGKAKHKTVGAKSLAQMAEAVPFGVANLASRIYSKYKLGEFITPPFNVTITNVPGPQSALYLRGHKIQGIFGLTPVLDGFGLIIAAFSYNGLVTITATSNAKSMPDADLFARYIRESANELEEVIKNNAKTQTKKVKEELKSSAFFADFKKYIAAQRFVNRKTTNVTYNFQIESETEDTDIGYRIADKKVHYRKRKIVRPSVHIKIDDNSLFKLSKGEVLLDELLIQEKLKIKGREKEVQRFKELLRGFTSN